MAAPVITKAIPKQIINALAAYGPVDLSEYVQSPDQTPLHFSAALANGQGLPAGLIVTEDGQFTGIPTKDTVGDYEVIITVSHDSDTITLPFALAIKPSLVDVDRGALDQIKAQVWQALENRLPIPDFPELQLDRPFTIAEYYYLLERWGIITMWDAYNLDAPADKTILNLEGASPHYVVYDRGSCLLAAPKDLFDHERTLEDGLKTARAMAREVYKRNWTIELTGFDKLTRAAWVEIQHLIDKHGKALEVINFKPRVEDVKLYQNQVLEARMKGGME